MDLELAAIDRGEFRTARAFMNPGLAAIDRGEFRTSRAFMNPGLTTIDRGELRVDDPAVYVLRPHQ